MRAALVQIVGVKQMQVFDSEVRADANDRRLVVVGRHVRGQREVLNEATRLALGRVGWAEHSPLARLERARPGHLPRLLELRGDPRHHPERRDEREARQLLRDTCPLHLEARHLPVAGGDCVDESR